ncbi:MAG: S-layer homology domain-containing protein [Clostridiales bacterium]
MKKYLLITTLIMAMVLCFSFGTLAVDVTNPDNADPNQYKIAEAIATGATDTQNLYIGTVKDWKANGSANFQYVNGEKTFFQNGEAISENDIIITNGKVGAVIAVGTRNPWGYPAGSILDAGSVENGVAKRDTTWSIEFLVNGRDGWAPNNCGIVDFKLAIYDFDKNSATFKQELKSGANNAVKVTRKYTVDGADIDVVTYYGIAAKGKTICMFDSLDNKGKALKTLGNCFSMTNKGDDGGSMAGLNQTVVSYGNITGKPYNISYTLPGENKSNKDVNHVWKKTGGSLGYKELRTDPGLGLLENEKVTYDEYIVIDTEPSMKAFYEFKDAHNALTTQAVTGAVKDSKGVAVPNPVIVVKNSDGSVYGWFTGEDDGTYSINLPKGEYKLFVERHGYAPGAEQAVTVNAAPVAQALTSGDAKVEVTFNVKDTKGKPLWSKVELFKADGKTSAYPTVRYTGDSVYLANDPEHKGVIKAMIEPGDYTAVFYAEGYWFYSEPQKITGKTDKTSVDVTVNKAYRAPNGWLAGDLHHHANKNDAFSDPQDAIPSMAAAGLDVGFVSDHDFTVNNKKAFDLSDSYGLKGFIPSEEISCSWAHFNVIPQTKEAYDYFKDDNKENHVMNQFGKLPDFVKQTHQKGASITANHPYQSYGLFYAYGANSIPGGYTDNYDNIELNACCTDQENADVIKDTVKLWTSYQDATYIYKTNKVDGTDVRTEKTHYLVGGSDTHDVKINNFATKDYQNSRADGLYASGKIRTMAYTGSTKPYTGNTNASITDTGLAYAKAALNGNSYVTYGPILNMDKVPGNDANGKMAYYDADGKFIVNIKIQSLNKIKDIIVLTKDAKDTYGETGILYDKSLSKLNVNAKVVDNCKIKVPVKNSTETWAAVMVYDVNGNYAITNPWWISSNNDSMFKDVDENMWYAPYINDLAKEMVIKGYGDGTFRPENHITRAEFVTMIAPTITATNKANITFSDVKKGEWYYDNVMKVAKCGIINGYEDKTFRPDALITRAEISNIIYLASGLKATTQTKFFTDVPDGEWYTEAINTLAANEYVNGNGDGTFTPNNSATRAESTKYVYALISDGAILLTK